MKKYIKIIGLQIIFLVLIGIIVYTIYPKTNLSVNGNIVKFSSINSNVIIISENPDFSNPRYIDLNETKNISLNLKLGRYYWKSDNGMVEGLKHEFVIESEVGLMVDRNENETDLVNIGNVKINVTKNEDGVMIGHIILEQEGERSIDDKNESYIGRQAE